MNHWNKKIGRFLASHLVLLATLVLSSSAVGGVTNTASVEAVVKKSIFEDNLKNSRDPMFPKSSRRAITSLPSGPIISPLGQLTLKGISGPVNRRFALINNQHIAAGETAVVKISSGQVTVRCWQISDKTAVISIEGEAEKKELSLRDGL